ncbi:uncharacterized protein BDV17DRAFT_289209 [Aspergillus undulatus]|uniref:uncharacterized protein n=1 Tax=Aspergillus undulatus TaxID=1810928 RepID=UPI003CCC9A97
MSTTEVATWSLLHPTRAAARLAAGGLESEVPEGSPQQLEGDLVWGAKPSRRAMTGQLFHTDSGDIVALFALETAVPGGGRARVNLLQTAGIWRFLRRPRDSGWRGRLFTFFLRILKSLHTSACHCSNGRRYFVGFGSPPRNPNILPISEAQAEALDTLHFTGERFCVNTEFQEGAIQYVNNLAIFHARDGFVDSEEKQGHLRLWLRDMQNAWHTPDFLAPRWAQIYEDVKPENEVFPLEPFIRSAGNKGR